VGAGKAAAAMAAAVEAHWPGPLSGLVVTRYGHGLPLACIALVEAGHPMPDAAGRDAARRILGLVAGLSADDLVLCLLSGGGSALLVEPASGLALEDKQAVTRALLACGAPIAAINTVRKHLSAIKGGRLAAAAYPAPTVTLVVSDVPGDDPATIASGPTAADPTTTAEARAVLEAFRIALPPAVARHLATAAAESPKPDDPRLARAAARIVACARDSLAAAAAVVTQAGLVPEILGDALEGEARELGRIHAARAAAARPGTVLLSGGETTVTLDPGQGSGGRNSEYLLALAVALDGSPGIHAIAADTDGIDGTGPAAGAVIGPATLAAARAAGLDGQAMLAAHDSGRFFATLGDAVTTGPTRTNVNDFRAILVT
ncbi:MAG: glycerate kinase, partial [Alphaproteobacteria bacterium]|nr:glycerate kinase [Alphaproteobacteria bacterium]